MSVYAKKSSEFRDIDIHELRKKQEKHVIEVLDQVIGRMDKEFKDHKKKFAQTKLVDLIPRDMDYFN